MAVYKDRGIDSWLSKMENLGRTNNIRLLEDLAANNSSKVVVFLDYASFHRSKGVGARASELGIKLVLKAAYSSA
jgi:hypothetical protein